MTQSYRLFDRFTTPAAGLMRSVVGTNANRTPADYGRFVEAAAALGLAKVLVSLAPFRWIARSASWQGTYRTNIADRIQPGSVVLAVKRASSRLPWRSVCLHQSLAAQWMLRRRGIRSQLHYGILPGEDRLTAHAWVGLGDQILLGEKEAARHARVASFPAMAE